MCQTPQKKRKDFFNVKRLTSSIDCSASIQQTADPLLTSLLLAESDESADTILPPLPLVETPHTLEGCSPPVEKKKSRITASLMDATIHKTLPQPSTYYPTGSSQAEQHSSEAQTLQQPTPMVLNSTTSSDSHQNHRVDTSVDSADTSEPYDATVSRLRLDTFIEMNDFLESNRNVHASMDAQSEGAQEVLLRGGSSVSSSIYGAVDDDDDYYYYSAGDDAKVRGTGETASESIQFAALADSTISVMPTVEGSSDGHLFDRVSEDPANCMLGDGLWHRHDEKGVIDATVSRAMRNVEYGASEETFDCVETQRSDVCVDSTLDRLLEGVMEPSSGDWNLGIGAFSGERWNSILEYIEPITDASIADGSAAKDETVLSGSPYGTADYGTPSPQPMDASEEPLNHLLSPNMPQSVSFTPCAQGIPGIPQDVFAIPSVHPLMDTTAVTPYNNVLLSTPVPSQQPPVFAGPTYRYRLQGVPYMALWGTSVFPSFLVSNVFLADPPTTRVASPADAYPANSSDFTPYVSLPTVSLNNMPMPKLELGKPHSPKWPPPDRASSPNTLHSAPLSPIADYRKGTASANRAIHTNEYAHQSRASNDDYTDGLSHERLLLQDEEDASVASYETVDTFLPPLWKRLLWSRNTLYIVPFGLGLLTAVVRYYFLQITKWPQSSFTHFKDLLLNEKIKGILFSKDSMVYYQDNNDETFFTHLIPGSEAFVFQSILRQSIPDIFATAEGHVTTDATPLYSFSYFLSTCVNVAIGCLGFYSLYKELKHLIASTRTVSRQTPPQVTLSNVGGMSKIKIELLQMIQCLKHPRRCRMLGARLPKGVLLYGPPGSGKTLLGRAIAGDAGIPFHYVSGASFVELFVGQGAARVREFFRKARENAPCIVFIDELDAIGTSRSLISSFSHEAVQTLNQLLIEMDCMDQPAFEFYSPLSWYLEASHDGHLSAQSQNESKSILILAATNRLSVLDEALTRPGRFDRVIRIELPSLQERIEIFKMYAKNKAIGRDVDWYECAEQTEGYSGAAIESLMNEAALLAARLGAPMIYKSHLLEVLQTMQDRYNQSKAEEGMYPPFF